MGLKKRPHWTQLRTGAEPWVERMGYKVQQCSICRIPGQKQGRVHGFAGLKGIGPGTSKINIGFCIGVWGFEVGLRDWWIVCQKAFKGCSG